MQCQASYEQFYGQPCCFSLNPAWISADPDHLAASREVLALGLVLLMFLVPVLTGLGLSDGSYVRHTGEEKNIVQWSVSIEVLGAYALFDIKSAQGPEFTAVRQATELATGLTVKTHVGLGTVMPLAKFGRIEGF